MNGPNIEVRLRNHYCGGKAMNITYSKCVSAALVIQHPMRMRHIVTCGLPGSNIFFYIISWTARILGKGHWTQNVCSDFLYNFETFPIIRITKRDTNIIVQTASCKVTVILVRLSWNLNFLNRFSKKEIL